MAVMINTLESKIVAILRQAAADLNHARFPEMSKRMDEIAGTVSTPCVVAVAGRMKAGKSSFLNALLREDLAKVGVTETTATINYFVYGKADDEYPVRCYWKDGRVTPETKEFLDSLQGKDENTLQVAMEIDHLEYAIENEYLRDVILVDTPGMCTTVEEHPDATARFLQLASGLRDKHENNSSRLQQQAHAVVYLVGEVARATDEALLKEFRQSTNAKTSALNAVGVLAKVDLSDALMKRRHELSTQIADQLKDELNTVVPVSAGLRRALDRIEDGELKSLEEYATTLKQISQKDMEKLLADQEFFLELNPAGCPVSTDVRKELLSDLPWGVFAQIARAVVNSKGDIDTVRETLDDMAGFQQVKDILDGHFFKRGRFLRLHHVLSRARNEIDSLRYKPLAEAKRNKNLLAEQKHRFIKFIQNAGLEDDNNTAKELECYIEDFGPRSNQVEKIELTIRGIGGELEKLGARLDEYNTDFLALQNVERTAGEFSSKELNELRLLFGMYGDSLQVRLGADCNQDVVSQRQRFWRTEHQLATAKERREVAGRAVERYGILLSEIMEHKH